MTDKVYNNGNIYTVNDEQSWAEAVAIKDGIFIKVGSNAEVNQLIDPHTEVVDLKGQFAMPGIYEMHVHATMAALREMRECQFSQFATQDEIRTAIEQYAAEHPGDDWIWGGGYGSNVFPEANPHKSFLDEIVPDRPVFIIDETGHNILANSKTLELAGITKNSKDPDGGIIERDPETGEPTGTLRETAMNFVMPLVPQPTAMEQIDAARLAAKTLSAYGIVEIKIAEGNEAQLAGWQGVEIRDHGLPMRVNLQIGWADEIWDVKDFDSLVTDPSQHNTHHVKIYGVKIMLDGVPMGLTSALLGPYIGHEDFCGKMMPVAASLNEDVIRFDKMGLSVMIHATGDAAVRASLDAVEAARKANGHTGVRHQTAHTSLTHPNDIHRFKTLGVAAEFGPPIWFPHPMLDSFASLLGEERMRERYWPTRTFIASGAKVVWGSDWPASVPDANPWPAMESLITRANPWGEYPGETLYPEEAIDLTEAIKIFTINGAWSLNREEKAGSIEVGKSGDMVVLDRNLFEIPAEEIGGTQVVRTIFEGNTVYEA
jgi:predicted amidohydrolase YtcJ